jgi:hypothetical protein
LLENFYRDGSRVSAQKLADGEVYHYDYIFDSSHKVMATIVTLPSGKIKRFLFHDGIATSEK